jgi:hypothetical protein
LKLWEVRLKVEEAALFPVSNAVPKALDSTTMDYENNGHV